MLYQVAIIHKPTQAELEKGEQETVLVDPSWIVAPNEQTAALRVAVENNDKVGKDPQASVLVRSF
jgi:hypothetical protein